VTCPAACEITIRQAQHLPVHSLGLFGLRGLQSTDGLSSFGEKRVSESGPIETRQEKHSRVATHTHRMISTFLKARLESGNSDQFVLAHHEESIHLQVPN
jgi:hypothetical protein